jgi:uroporphyrinogen decarboxylase
MILLAKYFSENKIPVWLMRQAGRYLPEYQEIRKTQPSFLDTCYNPTLAAEITLQPIKRFDFDAAIIFSDILVIPHSLGLQVNFAKDHGPMVQQITSEEDLKNLSITPLPTMLQPVYEAIELVRSSLDKKKPLIGFVGAPWTLACYMVEGKGSKDFSQAKAMAYNNSVVFQKIIDLLIEACVLHCINQIDSGAQIIQIFDSWAGILNKENYYRWVINPNKTIVQEIKKLRPGVPIICFPRKSGPYMEDFILEVLPDAISLDSDIDLSDFIIKVPKNMVIQGNLDPVYLLADDKNLIKEKITKLLDITRGTNHIFNLGHGVLPGTPIENVEYLMNIVKAYK